MDVVRHRLAVDLGRVELVVGEREHGHPGAEEHVFALGGGSHVLWLDPEDDLVMVARWVDKPAVDGLIARVRGSVVRRGPGG